MVTFLGAFPFPSQAPAIVTKEALIKVITLMTERHERVLKRGRRDRLKLFYGSLAVFDRRASEKLDQRPELEKPTDPTGDAAYDETLKGVSGFAIDEPSNDDEEIQNDDDELALAALDALDDIEAISLSEKPNLQHSIIPADNLLRLTELLVLIAPLTREDSLSAYASSLSEKDWESIRRTAASIVSTFGINDTPGITFYNFRHVVPNTMPYMFDGLSPLFERFLFQKDFDLSKRKASGTSNANSLERSTSTVSNQQTTTRAHSGSISHTRSRTTSHALPPRRPSVSPGGTPHGRSTSSSSIHGPRRSMSISSSQGTFTTEPFPVPIPEEPEPFTFADTVPPGGDILSPTLVSQLSFFVPPMTLLDRLYPLYSGSEHGFSLNSFEKQVSSWQSAAIFLVRGTVMEQHTGNVPATPMSPSLATPMSPSANPSERQFHSSLPPQRHSPSVKPGRTVTYGAYIPGALRQTHKAPMSSTGTVLFQLSPHHDVFRASDISTNHITFCSAPTDAIPGIGFGSGLPGANQGPGRTVLPLGAVSLFLNGALEYGVFSHSSAGGGSFYPSIAPARQKQRKPAPPPPGGLSLVTPANEPDPVDLPADWEDRFDIEAVEVWGLGGEREVKGRRRAMEFEEREAKIRREGRGSISGSAGVEADREILKMAGLIGKWDERGGSMG